VACRVLFGVHHRDCRDVVVSRVGLSIDLRQTKSWTDDNGAQILVVGDNTGNVFHGVSIEVHREIPGAPVAALKSGRDARWAWPIRLLLQMA
jgi:hypothetical protein